MFFVVVVFDVWTVPLKVGNCLYLQPHPWRLGVVFVFVSTTALFASVVVVVVCVSTAPLKVGRCLCFLCNRTLEGWELSLSLDLIAPRFCVPRGFMSQGNLWWRQ